MYLVTFRTIKVAGEPIDYKIYARSLPEAEEKLLQLYAPFDDVPPLDPPDIRLISALEVEPWSIPTNFWEANKDPLDD